MRFNFKQAALRHFNDAEFLFQDARWSNADQLYGLSAECILKHIISSLEPDSVNAVSGDFVNTDHKKHFESTKKNKDLWIHFSTHFSGRLAQHSSLPTANPFHDWDVFQRYTENQAIDHVRATNHQNGAICVHKFYQSLFENGVVT